MTDEDRSADRDPLDVVAEQFIARYRRGERPSLLEYEQLYPELAGELRDLLPALVMMEEVRPAAHDFQNQPPEGGTTARMLDRIGDYRILREVGRGGMGIVYEAEQESLGRHVALKVLPKHALLDPRQIERFRREARAAARLHHTNIVPVFGTGEYDGLYYHVMQFIQGLGLDQVLMEVARLRDVKESSAHRHGGRKAVLGGASGRAGRAAQVAQSLISGQFRRPNEHGTDLPQPSRHEEDPSPQASSARVEEVKEASLATGEGARREALVRGPGAGGGNGKSGNGRCDSSSKIHLPGQDVNTTESGAPYWRSVARIGVQVAEALAYANAQGVLHRDIKPSNLLLDCDGTVWVTDFGLAKASESDDLTHTGDIVGTLRYLAPERISGQADARSDIYSLGITLYELLTLRHPFTESDRGKLVRQIADDEPPRPRSLDPALPRDLETIVLKAIAKRPGDRYPNASSLAADLRHFLHDQPIQARRIGHIERIWRWCRRNPMISGLVVAVALLAIVLGVGTLFAQLVRVQRDQALANLTRAAEAEEEARASQGRAEHAEQQVKVRSHLALATAHRRSGRIGQRWKCLEELAEAVRLGPSKEIRTELRDEATAAMGLIDLRQVWTRAVPSVLGVQFDDNLQRYAVAEVFESGDVVVRRVADDRVVDRLPRPTGSFQYVATTFSPDGRYLAAQHWGSDSEPLLRVWDFDSHTMVLELRVSSGEPPLSVGETPYHAFHPNGRWFLFCSTTSELVTFDLESKREVRRWPLGLKPRSVCVDREGKRVAVNAANTPLIKLFDVASGKELVQWHSDVGTGTMGWSDDGELLATADFGRIYVTHVSRGQLISVLQGQTSRVTTVQFSPDRRLLATHSWDGTTRLWDPVTGETLLVTSGEFVRFSRDGTRVSRLSEGTLSIWELTRGRECVVLQPDRYGNRDDDILEGYVRGVDFSPDGRLLATGSFDGARLWDATSGNELAYLPIGRTTPVLFHPDGGGLITSGHAGLLWWPIRHAIERDRETVQIGPPRIVWASPIPIDDRGAAWLPGARQIAVHNGSEVLILDLASDGSPTPEPVVLRIPHRSRTGIAVSEDGNWLAVGGWREFELQIWDLRSREPARSLPASDSKHGSIFQVCFSPDSRWLVSIADNPDAQGYYFWRTGSWTRGPFVPSPMAEQNIVFAPNNSHFAALGIAPHELSLLDISSQKEIVRMALPRQAVGFPVRFNYDGSQLAVVKKPRSVLVWNLRALREGLADLGLDWDYAPFPAESPVAADRAIRVQVNGIAPRSMEETAQRNLDSCRRAFQANPEDAVACNNLAWALATAPESARNLAEALTLAEKAMDKDPDATFIRNTLGLVYYRLSRYHDAITVLLPNVKNKPDVNLTSDLFILAMSYHQLGEYNNARAYFDMGVRWGNLKKARSSATLQELAELRAEAEAELGIEP